MLLQIKNLTVQYAAAGVKALDGVSVDVRDGEILGIVGESGSGKSTLAYSLLGLLPYDCAKSGSIIFEEKDIFSLPDKELEKLRGREAALITQDAAGSLNPVLTVGYQFRELLRYKAGIAGEKAETLISDFLARVHLPDRQRVVRSYPHQLSGGMLQRVCIAMSLALSPRLLIADEPTSSLDITIESQIIHLFKELKQSLNLTVLFITHNLDIVRVLCDRAVVLQAGRVREIQETSGLFSTPKDEYTKSLLSSLKELE